jgi:hypothetical protein
MQNSFMRRSVCYYHDGGSRLITTEALVEVEADAGITLIIHHNVLDHRA